MSSDADENTVSARRPADQPAANGEAARRVPDRARDLTGRTLGHYQIVSKLGAGGMGEVYRARDADLRREVAIKVLPERLSGDPDQLARLKHEARVLAALNHPNIATLYGFESSGDTEFIVMELVAGETLADIVQRGPVTLERALAMCGQVADALEAAHSQGITHRDIKPANIKVTPEGRVKVLDFGLAKSAVGADALGTASVTVAGTYEGHVVGTPAYMSPEQVRGKSADRRADIWAFGCVLFEMLSGRRPFPGDTVSDALAKILEREPDWKALPSSTPVSIVHLIRTCLEKDPDRRLASMAGAREVIGAAQKPGWRPSRRDIVAAVVLFGVVASALGGYWLVTRKGAAPGGEVSAARVPSADAAAERLCREGRYFWNLRTDEGLRKSADAFRQAVARDPNYAPAWAGQADAYLMLGGWSVVPAGDAYPRAKAAADRAILLDPVLAEPHATLGYFHTIYSWDWSAAEREFRRAIELRPTYSTAHHWYGFYFLTIGDGASAVREIERARELDPLSQVINDEVGYFYMAVRDYTRAVTELRKTIDLDPASTKARLRLAEAHAFQGKTREALAEVDAVRLNPVGNVTETVNATVVYSICGDRSRALALVRDLEEQARTRYVMPAMLATAHAAVGNKDRAFELLNQALNDRTLVVSWLRYPNLDPLRGDPRLKALFDRVRLPM